MKTQVVRNIALATIAAAVFAQPTMVRADAGAADAPKPSAGALELAKEWFSGLSTKATTLIYGRAPYAVMQTTAAATTSRQPAQEKTASQPTTTAPAIETQTASGSSGPVVSDIPRSATGVPVYQISDVDSIPRLDIGKEERISSKQYRVQGPGAAALDHLMTAPLETPSLLTPSELALFRKVGGRPLAAKKIQMYHFPYKGVVSSAGVDKIVINKKSENKMELAKVTPLSADEYRFLSGLLLYQQGDKCAVAVGLFHELSKSAKYEAEGNYYTAMCSKKLGLITDFIERARRVVLTKDVHYTNKILAEVNPDLPFEFIEPFGDAVLKVVNTKGILDLSNPTVVGNVDYILANYGAQTGNWKLAQQYGKQVTEKHDKWPQAQYILALAEYETGSKAKALALQEDLVKKLDTDKTKAEFQGLVILNLARMYFQEEKYKEARETFQKIYKDHPLWLQGLQEMGWSQLQSGDFEGAIGNMYSMQAPYFNGVYKPESYVIRTIGYLNLCQYGDAYRTLSTLEKTYRPWQKKMEFYRKVNPDYLSTVRKFIAQRSAAAEIDGLPSQVIREMVRHRDYTNLQQSMNRQLDEVNAYASLDKEVEKSLARARWLVNNSRKRTEDLRNKIASIKKNPQLEQNRLQWKQEYENELVLLNGYFFNIDLFNEAKTSLQTYKFEVVAGAEARVTKMRNRIVRVLADRLGRMTADLKTVLDNNELLRYEVFSGSGENIRYQVAGGEKGNRVPADVIPKSKSLQWDFAGEYWEDEIGHYRSSLKNNCPDTKTAGL